MRLNELGLEAVERRVKAMKASAKTAKERARQLKAQADINAERLEMQKSRQALNTARRSSVASTIKPYR